jgi:pimeloyl-ACP methyl ester carboxylesterase
MAEELRHRTIATHGIQLHTVEAGPEDGPLVVLLHGFPELWYGWREQIGPLARAGFRVLVPDQRGYNRSDKPKGVSAYSLDRLAGDVVGLIDAAGCDQACLAGHDWGGAVAWWTAITHPKRIAKLAVLNLPHPDVFRWHLWTHPAQLRKSWYIFAFQLPWLPERLLRRNDWARTVRALQKSARPGTFSEADLAVYREAWGQPGAITAMLDWYRAALRARPRQPASTRVRVPTLLLWGAQDDFLGREMAQPSIDRCDGGRLVFLEKATHWLQHEEPEEVNRQLHMHFALPDAPLHSIDASEARTLIE